jgi:hypothetical protein
MANDYSIEFELNELMVPCIKALSEIAHDSDDN